MDKKLNENKIICVCSNCKRANCWYGEFMCEGAFLNATTELKTVKELREINTKEHEDNWSDKKMKEIYGDINPFKKHSDKTLKTLKEWEEIFEMKVLDADGFNFDVDHKIKLFSKSEFEKGCIMSTCEWFVDYKSPVIMVYKIHTEDCGWCAFEELDDAIQMFKAEIEEENFETEFEVAYMRKCTYENLSEFEG